MLDYICNGSVDLFGTGRERKISNENMSPAGFEPILRQSATGTQRLRPLGHDRGLDGDQWFNVLQNNRVQIKKTVT